MVRALPVTTLLFALLLFTCGCGGGGSDGVQVGGSAGVRNGGILGSVRGSGAQGVLPILGATAVAVRQESPPVTRSTQSDANGEFILSNLPVGRYRLGFSADGFLPIYATGSQAVDVFVESSSFSRAPSVILEATAGGGLAGPSNVLVTLLDDATGEPISNATVTAGIATASSGANGVYSLQVPVSQSGSLPVPVGLSAQVEGYDPQSLTPNQIGVVPGRIVTVTARMGPFATGVSGRVRALGASSSLLSSVEVRVTGINPAYSRGTVNGASGTFRVTVPASTYGRTRMFTLTFVSPYFNLAVVPNVTAPYGGDLTLPGEVVLTPVGANVVGTVVCSDSLFPGAGSTVTIVELGRQAGIVNGSYSFTGVPAGLRLTLQVAAFNRLGGYETGTATIGPLGGSGTFNVATIITR